jgi:hypothetical protein
LPRASIAVVAAHRCHFHIHIVMLQRVRFVILERIDGDVIAISGFSSPVMMNEKDACGPLSVLLTHFVASSHSDLLTLKF